MREREIRDIQIVVGFYLLVPRMLLADVNAEKKIKWSQEKNITSTIWGSCLKVVSINTL